MKRLIVPFMLVGLCSCGDKVQEKDQASRLDAGSAPTPPAIPSVNTPRSKEVIRLERRVMGRWRSASGVLAGSRNQWIILDIAGTKDARLEIRSNDVGHDTVTAFANGKVAITYTGMKLSLPDANGALADFRTADGTMVDSSRMSIKTGNGRVFELVYNGQ